MCCGRCSRTVGLLVLLVGIAYLLVDFGVWNLMNIQWWTMAFLIIGVGALGMAGCPSCQTMAAKPVEKPKKSK